jgi:3-methylcrotonyl-CoA carboxylase alpha subunit
MLKKVLIANRGEIAARIIRTARRMGLGTVAVYSDADARCLYVASADEAVHIGPSPATDSYLRFDKILAAAKATGADCIHPGYGFLAENAGFADACAEAGIKFIGPSGEAMRKLGGKAEAKIIARAAGVPVVPGYDGDKQDAKTLAKEAARIGYPVMIKAVAGGGGRGMRLVEKAADFAAALESAQREAQSAFGDAGVLIEKLVVRPRHIEVQVFGDAHGNVVHLFERDCSLQRRNQKVIEEAPAPGMSEALRKAITGAAVALAKSVGYEGAGTVEFLVEGGRLGPEAPWYFIEMNTRLQVEHPVTEAITGLDLVEWQLRVASGERLPLGQDAITMQGHAIEARVCAEDPARNFMPSLGRLVSCFIPESAMSVRVDTGFRSGDVVSPFYDSLLAKVIAAGRDRSEALAKLTHALETQCDIAGPRTNIGFLAALIAHPEVVSERMDTGLIGRDLAKISESGVTREEVEEAALTLIGQAGEDWAERAEHLGGDGSSPWAATDGFSLGPDRSLGQSLFIDGAPETFDVVWKRGQSWPVLSSRERKRPSGGRRDYRRFRDGNRVFLLFGTDQVEVAWPEYAAELEDGDSGGAVRAPINGKLARLLVAKGDKIGKGDRVAIVEAMKMEHVLTAPIAGTVAEVAGAEGAQVTGGQLIVNIAEAEGA